MKETTSLVLFPPQPGRAGWPVVVRLRTEGMADHDWAHQGQRDGEIARVTLGPGERGRRGSPSSAASTM